MSTTAVPVAPLESTVAVVVPSTVSQLPMLPENGADSDCSCVMKV
ncbi:hypothetical protein [Nocardiopsis metallicus]|uniref:Uncharacterized protein n=1 Tax=Nocardiopsis metallicus TaxID=179819 RepID=A0A840WB62_9ACTN|nr:hypothetical protein [Nocardiopsis metallicus]MBB5493362.1 hypothetical protein [Nocardiopsis metallicus]